MEIEKIAEVCHEANRALQRQSGEVVNFPWESTSDELRNSAIDGVKEAQLGATPEQLHNKWCEYKVDEGWVYGPVKSFVSKEHPCLVPYDALPPAQRIKDKLFQAIVGALS